MQPIKNSLDKLYLTPKDLQNLGVVKSQSTLRNWRKKNIGPTFLQKPHKRYVYPLDPLLEWIKSGQSPWADSLSSPLLVKILEMAKDEV